MNTLTTDQLKKMKSEHDDLLLINTLSKEHFDETHIPGAINIPLENADFVDKVEEAAGGKGKSVVVYCASEECQSSTKAAQKLEESGFANVYDYEGGAKAWDEAGEALLTA